MNPETTIPGLNHKILRLEEFAEERERMRKMGERVVQCHGVFDLLHPGHVSHLQEAKALGDRLVVSVTEDGCVNRVPGATRLPARLAHVDAGGPRGWWITSSYASTRPRSRRLT